MTKKITQFYKWIVKKDNDNVIFESSIKRMFLNGLLIDSIFFLIYIILPFILSSIGRLTGNESSDTLYIVNFSLLGVTYPIGMLLYWRHNHVSLIRNGGIGFFVAVILFQLIVPIIQLILDKTVANINYVKNASIIIEDILKLVMIATILRISGPVRKDIKISFFKRTISLFIITIIFTGLYFLIWPLFNYINEVVTTNKYPEKDRYIILSFQGNDFITYWNMIIFILVTPLFYELIFRHSIMTLMRTDIMKIVAPTLYFVVSFLIIDPSKQDVEHFFYYFWWSLLLTFLLYIKRNVSYTITTSSLISQINLLRFVL